jgi:hypothetical protein
MNVLPFFFDWIWPKCRIMLAAGFRKIGEETVPHLCAGCGDSYGFVCACPNTLGVAMVRHYPVAARQESHQRRGLAAPMVDRGYREWFPRLCPYQSGDVPGSDFPPRRPAAAMVHAVPVRRISHPSAAGTCKISLNSGRTCGGTLAVFHKGLSCD